MTELPIRFNGEMVRAILDGSKTQTRLACQASLQRYAVLHIGENGYVYQGGMSEQAWAPGGRAIRCPYKVGQSLWVRETWQHYYNGHELYAESKRAEHCFYRADESDPAALPMSGKWRPSIHMPRWASRIDLEVAGVRVERVHQIDARGVAAEGLSGEGYVAVQRFQRLWDSINGKKHPWAANPWVWVIEFVRVRP